MKALVVENSNTMRAVLHRILSVRGFEVADAENPREAMELLHDIGKADLVLVDWARNEQDSIDLITRIRSASTRDTVVIMMASNEPEIRTLHRALIAGADDYLMKPCTLHQIDEKLAQAGFNWHL
jgi:two-component system, chemotaxis family, chemotaxis protein CheY